MHGRGQYFLSGKKMFSTDKISQTLLEAGSNDTLLWKKDFHCQKQSLCMKENFYLSPL